MYMSCATADPKVDADFAAPMVLTVGADKKLEALQTYFHMWVVSIKNNKVEKRLADRFVFTPKTEITFVEKKEDDKKEDDKKDDTTNNDSAASTSRVMSNVASSSIKVVDVMPRSFEFTEECIWIPAN